MAKGEERGGTFVTELPPGRALLCSADDSTVRWTHGAASSFRHYLHHHHHHRQPPPSPPLSSWPSSCLLWLAGLVKWSSVKCKASRCSLLLIKCQCHYLYLFISWSATFAQIHKIQIQIYKYKYSWCEFKARGQLRVLGSRLPALAVNDWNQNVWNQNVCTVFFSAVQSLKLCPRMDCKLYLPYV